MRESVLQWRLDKAAPIRFILRMRPANSNGATLQFTANGSAAGSCALKSGQWTDCRVQIPEATTHAGINQLTLAADSISPTADRPGDPRELSFVMQAGRVRVGQ